MIQMLKPRNREFKVAWLLKKDDNVENRKRFRYSIVSELQKSYSQPIRNLVTQKNSFVIMTNYLHNFEVGDYVFLDYACNEKFKIKNRAKFQHNDNEQVLAMVKNNPSTYWVLDLE